MITNETFLVIYLSAVMSAVISVFLNDWINYKKDHGVKEYFLAVISALIIGGLVFGILYLIFRLVGII